MVDSLSKRFSLCGARIGCFVTNNDAIAVAAMKLAQARLSPPALAQVVAARANRLPADYFATVKSEYKRRRDTVFQAFLPGVTVHRPEGAFYQMARLPVDDSEAFVRFMLNTFHRDGETVMLAPAGGFYATPGAGQDEVRIAYVLEREKLERAMWLLERRSRTTTSSPFSVAAKTCARVLEQYVSVVTSLLWFVNPGLRRGAVSVEGRSAELPLVVAFAVSLSGHLQGLQQILLCLHRHPEGLVHPLVRSPVPGRAAAKLKLA